jgi:pyridoxine 4-dehydrogenase
MRLTGEGIWSWPSGRENAKKVLRRALKLGVNFIGMAAFHRMWAAPQKPKNA